MTLGLSFAVRSDVGLLRDGNEDAAYAGRRLLAVADGMGGHAAGEVASRLAIASVTPLDDDIGPDVLTALRGAVHRAQEDIRSRVAADRALEGMGTTLTALLWTGSGIGLAHVGDSRAYLFRDGVLEQITDDHTYVQELVDSEQITASEAMSHPQRSLLTRALDGRTTVEPDLFLREANVGDRFLLCSDGLCGVVRDATLATTLATEDVEEAADSLVELALRGGGPDNITVVVCDLIDEADPGRQPVVVGAAADVETPTRGGDTPAGRAATAVAGTQQAGTEQTGTERRRLRFARRPVWVLLALGVMLAGAALGGWVWTRTQYFVGLEGDRVAIFRGVAWSVAGRSLHSVSEQVAVDPARLPEFERGRLRDGISASTLPQARRVADRLASQQCAVAAVVPTLRQPSQPTAAPPTPRPSAAPAAVDSAAAGGPTAKPCPSADR